MRWPWRRRRPKGAGVKRDGGPARAAHAEAEAQLSKAKARSPRVDETVRAARELVRRTDAFAREAERALRQAPP